MTAGSDVPPLDGSGLDLFLPDDLFPAGPTEEWQPVFEFDAGIEDLFDPEGVAVPVVAPVLLSSAPAVAGRSRHIDAGWIGPIVGGVLAVLVGLSAVMFHGPRPSLGPPAATATPATSTTLGAPPNAAAVSDPVAVGPTTATTATPSVPSTIVSGVPAAPAVSVTTRTAATVATAPVTAPAPAPATSVPPATTSPSASTATTLPPTVPTTRRLRDTVPPETTSTTTVGVLVQS